MNDMCGIKAGLSRPFRAGIGGRGNPGLRCALRHSTLGYSISPLRGWQVLALVLVLMGLSVIAEGQSKKKTPAATPLSAALDNEEYAVYSVLLQALYASGAKLLVLDNYTSGCVPIGNNAEGEKAWQQSLNSLPSKLPKLRPKTLADFKSKVRQCRTVEAKLTLPVKYVLLSKQERQQIFAISDTKKAWANFHQKYAGATGYINVSNIGFNEERTQALVNTYRKCGVQCGAEKIVLLTKVNGQWSVAATHKIWEL